MRENVKKKLASLQAEAAAEESLIAKADCDIKDCKMALMEMFYKRQKHEALNRRFVTMIRIDTLQNLLKETA